MQPRSRGTADLELAKSRSRALLGARNKNRAEMHLSGTGGTPDFALRFPPRSFSNAFLRDF